MLDLAFLSKALIISDFGLYSFYLFINQSSRAICLIIFVVLTKRSFELEWTLILSLLNLIKLAFKIWLLWNDFFWKLFSSFFTILLSFYFSILKNLINVSLLSYKAIFTFASLQYSRQIICTFPLRATWILLYWKWIMKFLRFIMNIVWRRLW